MAKTAPAAHFYLNADILYSRLIQTLSPRQFVKAFEAAVRGEESLLSPFVRIPKSNRPAWSEWAVIRTAVFTRDDFTCQYCGARGGKLECDHVVPVSRGGAHEPSNLKTACRPCNRDKGTKTLEEWHQTSEAN